MIYKIQENYITQYRQVICTAKPTNVSKSKILCELKIVWCVPKKPIYAVLVCEWWNIYVRSTTTMHPYTQP